MINIASYSQFMTTQDAKVLSGKEHYDPYQH